MNAKFQPNDTSSHSNLENAYLPLSNSNWSKLIIQSLPAGNIVLKTIFTLQEGYKLNKVGFQVMLSRGHSGALLR